MLHPNASMMSMISIATEMGTGRPNYKPIVLPTMKPPRLITELNEMPALSQRSTPVKEQAAPKIDDPFGFSVHEWLLAEIYEPCVEVMMD